MAKDILVADTLSEQMIKAGAKLVEELDSARSQVQSAFWLFFSDENIWKLIVASPLVASEGPKKFYHRIAELTRKEIEDGIDEVLSLNNIEVTDTNNRVVQLLRVAIKTGDDVSGARFSRNTINGMFIEDSYIYRSN